MKLTEYTPRLEYQVYPEEYFSGADVSIYLGDAWVDEIVSINFTLMEYVQPIFGYNSYVYDVAARGSRLVSGNFRINFRESYYLHKIISDATFLDGVSNDADKKNKDTDKFDPWQRYSADRVEADEVVFNQIIDSNEALKKLRDQVTAGKMSKDQLMSIAKRIQDQNWEKKTFDSKADRNSPFFKSTQKGLTIIIMYGSRFNSISGRSDYNRIFDIPPSTVYTISGLQLSSVSHVVAVDGQPVYEDYSFIAQDLEPGV